jgi:predicted DNA-binding transcriptional regulator AlpA
MGQAVSAPLLRPVPTLADLLADPVQAMDLPQPEAVRLLAQVGALAEVLRARLAMTTGANGHEPESKSEPDRLLTPEQVGERTGFSRAQVYRRAKRWPFTRRPSKGTLRFSERGFEAWMAGRKPD